MVALANIPAQAPRTFCTHFVDYFMSADGPADLLKGMQLGAQYAQLFPLTERQRQIAAGVRGSASDAWSMLVWGDVAGEGARFIQKTARVFDVIRAPARLERGETVSDVAAQALLQGNEFLINITEGVFLLHTKKWIDLGELAPSVYGCFEVTSIISDVVDVRNQRDNMRRIQAMRPDLMVGEDEERQGLYARERFCRVRLVKDGVSIAFSVFGLAAMFVGIEASAFVSLVLATILLVTKIFAHFYERVVIEQLRPLAL